MELLKLQIQHVIDKLEPQYQTAAKRRNYKARILGARVQTLKDVLKFIKEIEDGKRTMEEILNVKK